MCLFRRMDPEITRTQLSQRSQLGWGGIFKIIVGRPEPRLRLTVRSPSGRQLYRRQALRERWNVASTPEQLLCRQGAP